MDCLRLFREGINMKNILLLLAISVIIIACNGNPANSGWLIQPTEIFSAQTELPLMATPTNVVATAVPTKTIAVTITPTVYVDTVLVCKVSTNVKDGMLHIRSCPSLSCSPIGYLIEGQEVEYKSIENGWRKLSDNQFIKASYCGDTK